MSFFNFWVSSASIVPIAVFLLFIVSWVSFAESQGPQNFVETSLAEVAKPEIKFEYRDDLQPEDIVKMRARLLMVSEALAPYFGVAPKLTVIAYKDSLVPLFGYRWVKLPIHYQRQRDLPDGKTETVFLKDPDQLWIHEYSHAYFHRALAKALSEWLKQSNADLDALNETQTAFVERERIISRPYNELFADAVAAILLDNGKTFADFENFAGGTAEEAKARDFTVEHSLENLPVPDSVDGWYIFLAPARTAIWNQYQKHEEDDGFSKGKFLHQLYNALEAQIFIVASDVNGLSRTPKRLNQDLIKKIEEITGKE